MLHCQSYFNSHLSAVGIETSDLPEGDRLITDICVQIGDERRAFPTKRAHPFTGFHPGRQVSHRLRGAVSCGLDADLARRLLNSHRHRTDRRTLCRSLAPRQIHRPGSREVRQALRGQARLGQRCDAQRPKETLHPVRICNWSATQESCEGLKIEPLRSEDCPNIRHVDVYHFDMRACLEKSRPVVRSLQQA